MHHEFIVPRFYHPTDRRYCEAVFAGRKWQVRRLTKARNPRVVRQVLDLAMARGDWEAIERVVEAESLVQGGMR